MTIYIALDFKLKGIVTSLLNIIYMLDIETTTIQSLEFRKAYKNKNSCQAIKNILIKKTNSDCI